MDWLKKNKYLILLAILFFAQFLIISPIGEFPLNDDWVHAEMVEHWAKTNSFRLNPYTGPLLYAQLVYATGLIKIFGFSFTLLRLSTLGLTTALVFGIYLFLKKYTKHESVAFFGTLLVWLNPLIYSMSFTFMSDVPALAFIFFSIIAFYNGIEKNKVAWFWLGACSAVIGFFIRQTTILLLPAAGFFTVMQSQYRKIKYSISIIVPGLIAIAIYYFLAKHNLLGQGTSFHEIASTRELTKHATYWLVYTGLYCGLFLFPLTIALFKKNYLSHYLFFSGLSLSLVSWLFFHKQQFFPYVTNTINQYGLGPLHETLSGHYIPLFSNWVWYGVTLVAGIGLGFLLTTIWTIITRKQFYASKQFFIAFFAVLFLIPILIFTGFDRYFIALILAGGLIIILENPQTKIPWLGWTLLAIMACYSVSQTHFYMEWNRTRAELVNVATTTYSATPSTLDSGYEWTGYQDYWEAAKIPKVYRWPAGSPWWIRFLMININREYVISSSPENEYSVIEKRSVFGLNPNNHLYLLKKNDEPVAK